MLNRQKMASALMTLSLSACGAWQAASDSTVAAYDTAFHNRGKRVNVDLTARADLNQDDAGRPRSVAVRVYQLKDRTRFDGASYNDLLDKDGALLAPDVLSNVATVVNPGASASVSEPMRRDTKFVAIAAFYQNADKTGSWKQVVPAKKLPDGAPLKLTLAKGTLDVSEDNTNAGKK